MFDDIIKNKSDQIIDPDKYEDDPRCIQCKSRNFKEDGGKFINARLFRFGVKCQDCNYTWQVFINEKIKITEIKRCGYDNSTA